MAQKTEHPADLNKWGPLRVSNVLRPDNRVAAGPVALCTAELVVWVYSSARAVGPNGRGVFYVRLGSLVCVFIFGRVSGGCLGAVALARSACGLGWAPVALTYSC